MNLSGCDKVILKHSINGSRFIVSWPQPLSVPHRLKPPLTFVNDVFSTESERPRPAEIPQTSCSVSSDISPLSHSRRTFWRVGYFRLLFIPLPDSLARYWIHPNGVWSSLCICAPGWFPRSARRSARRMRKEGCSVGSMFQMTQLCPKHCWVVHTWLTVVAPMWLWLCFLFIAELHQNTKNQVWTLTYGLISSNGKQLNLQLQFCINGLVIVECAWCAAFGVFSVCVCAEVTAESQGWDEDEFVCVPFRVFLSKNIFFLDIFPWIYIYILYILHIF